MSKIKKPKPTTTTVKPKLSNSAGAPVKGVTSLNINAM